MIGTIVSHYKILAKLGEGGMGVVYKAHDTKLDRTVALKFLPHHLVANDEEKARFLQEARAAAALNHPNVCSVIDLQEHEDQQFIIMEYVEGSTLREKAPVQKVRDAIHYAIQVGDALHAAHGKGIVHRDIKSENIMLTTDGRIKVMDFGLAKLKGSLRLTRTSSTVGTLAYMAPEQLQGSPIDARSDIFSFGVVLFELLTAHMPFRGDHEAALMYSLVHEDPESVTTYRQDLSEEFDRIIQRALEKDPADRYQDVNDMVIELRRLQRSSARATRPEQTVPPPQTMPVIIDSTKKSFAKVWLGMVAVAGIALAAWFVFFHQPTHRITSMAVLPFVNVGEDPATEYLSDGFTESLINSLSKLPGVKLMSRNSVFRYKGKEIDPQHVGRELAVGAVLLGRITQKDDALKVSVELVNTSDNSHIWGEQYERPSSAIISLQNDISRALSKHLNITLTGSDEKSITKNHTENTEAYQLYLKGRFQWNKRTAESLVKAAALFQNALEKDPGYALAYAALAESYSLMSSYFVLPPPEALSKAKAAAVRAIELDHSLAEPHTTLAIIASEFEWDFDRAEREFRQSLVLNPGYPTTHHWYGEFLVAMGRGDEGMRSLLKAIELDPLAPILYNSTGWAYYMLGEYDKALSYEDRALELDPRFPRALATKMLVYDVVGKPDEALQYAREALAASANDIEYRAWLAYAYARAGKRKEAEAIIGELLEMSRTGYVSPALFAYMYTGIGNKDKAFEWLMRVLDSRSTDALFLNVEPLWRTLRDDPRFSALVRKVGLPE